MMEFYIDKEIIDVLDSVYVMKKLEDRSFSLINKFDSEFKYLMLSSDSNNYLMITQNDYHIKLLFHLYKDLDDNIINLMLEYKKQYCVKNWISNRYLYGYEFTFSDSKVFADFFKSNIFPLLGIAASENIFSWI